jgi:membrane-bound lytic murein transglycosylase D
VTTSKDVDVSLAAQFARMTVEEFRAMNPSFNKPVILGASEPQILLPYGRAQSFQENLNAYKGRLSSWTAIRLGARETVDQLATRLNVEAHQIREINDIPKGMRIKAGSTVIVPKVGKSKDVPEHLANNTTQLLLEKEVAAKKKGAKKKGAKTTGAKKTASNGGATNKAKPKGESKVASNSKKSN